MNIFFLFYVLKINNILKSVNLNLYWSNLYEIYLYIVYILYNTLE